MPELNQIVLYLKRAGNLPIEQNLKPDKDYLITLHISHEESGGERDNHDGTFDRIYRYGILSVKKIEEVI